MNYGILASGSCLLTDIVDQLHEPSRKINIVDRLSRYLTKGTPIEAVKAYLMLDSLQQDYVIHLTAKRKLLFHNKWILATKLRNRRKGKVKLPLFSKGKMHDAYLSHVNIQITSSRKNISLVLVYGITEHPMMLATNKEIKSKDDVIKVAMLYFSRWRIEEYFRCKKQRFQFKNFRIRKLKAINALNFYITLWLSKGIFCILSYAKEGIRR